MFISRVIVISSFA